MEANRREQLEEINIVVAEVQGQEQPFSLAVAPTQGATDMPKFLGAVAAFLSAPIARAGAATLTGHGRSSHPSVPGA